MGWKILAVVFLVALVALAAFMILPQQEEKKEIQAMAVDVLGAPESVSAGETFLLSASAKNENGVSKIIFEAAGKENAFDCAGKTECTVESAIAFGEIGVQQVKIRAIGIDAREAGKKIIVRVMPREKQCNDETPFGKCSGKKPLYCENGALIEMCGECGCIEGMECGQGGNCSAKAIALKIEGLSAEPAKTKPMRAVTLKLELANKTTITAKKGAEYRLRVEIFDEKGNNVWEKEKNFVLNADLAPNSGLIQGFGGVVLGRGIFSARAEIFDGNTLLDSAEAAGIVEVIDEDLAPAAPTGLGAFPVVNGLRVYWSANTESDLAAYRLYGNVEANSAYISYAFLKEIKAPETGVELLDLNAGKYYFVLTAVDGLGNESPYSQIAAANVK
ncbi:MAG: hypothetical protein V1494_01040 [Candidatus Diapherotrites archaeon]